jgi:4-amino-4-deoxychorismate lyase
MIFHSINGQQVNEIALNDRALNYGDGLFTTAKIVDGGINLFEYHLERLTSGCAKLGIAGVDFDWLIIYLTDIVKRYDNAVLKILISAGQGGRGYSRVGVAHPNVIISIHDFPQHYLNWKNHGIHLGTAQTKLGINPQLAGLKHLNRLEQVLVRNELDQREEDDLLVLNINEQVIEVCSANIFYQLNGHWYTPDLSLSGVNGVMRQHILACRPDIKVVETSLSDITEASAMFICNSIAKIIPVYQFNERQLNIADIDVFKERFSC